MKNSTKASLKRLACSVFLGVVLVAGSGCDKEALGLTSEFLGEVVGGQGFGASGGGSSAEALNTENLAELYFDPDGLKLSE